MSINQVDRYYTWFPAQASSTTITVSFIGRATKDSGAWASLASLPGGPNIPALVVVYPTGRNGGVTLDSFVEAVVQYALNNGLSAWYSPPNGRTVREALLAAFSAFGGSLASNNTSASLNLLFNGQFGDVHATWQA